MKMHEHMPDEKPDVSGRRIGVSGFAAELADPKAPDWKKDFPLLCRYAQGERPIAYLDNAATTQKPRQVIEAVRNYYESYSANPHRGAYAIAEQVTEAFEAVREKTASFLNARSSEEIVFTSGTTEALNLVAIGYGGSHVSAGDEILITVMEHHSNLLPWQRLAKEKGAVLRYLYPDSTGQLSLETVAKALNPRTKMVSVTQISNVLGVLNPIREIGKLVHEAGAVLVVDAAQSAPHISVDVQDLDADFLAFSGHKMLAPAGIGVLYGKKERLAETQPLRLGGGMVEEVTEQTVRYLDPPHRFEGGTQNAEGVIGLGAAIDYLKGIGMEEIVRREKLLTEYALDQCRKIPQVILYGGDFLHRGTGIVSFNVADVHPHDTATVLATKGVAVRAGHHCAQPLMQWLKVNATCRMSLYFYNTQEDVDRMMSALREVRGVLGYGTAGAV